MPMDKREIEKVFTTSGSKDELFDAFREAIAQEIRDNSLYNILLANKALSNDEIIMYAEKICKDFPELCPSIYFWTARVFESLARHLERMQKAALYYKKSIMSDDSDLRPYISLAKMYNPELDVPPFKEMLSILTLGISKVEEKSKLCFALSDLFKRKDDPEKSAYYRMLGEKYQRKENYDPPDQ
jgi:tetratricopeptide (TPR) repeat protein